MDARVTDAWGDPSLPLSMALSAVLNGFVKTLMNLDSHIEQNLLSVVIPGRETTGDGPAWRAAHWMGSDAKVGSGPVPTWLQFDELAGQRPIDADWNSIDFLVGMKADGSGVIARYESAWVDDPMEPLSRPERAALVLGTFAQSIE